MSATVAETTPAGSAAAESTWVTASTELRSTAKWVITALAAVAAVVFGAGPIITKPSLDFEDDLGQLLIAGAFGVAGLIGIGILIFGITKVLLPVEMSLDDLPPELLAKIQDTPDSLLPGGVPTLAAFRDRVAAMRTAVVEIPEKIEDQEFLAEEAQAAGDGAAYAAAQAAIKAYQAALVDNQASLTTYEAVRSDLIDRGAYTQLSGVFSGQRKALWAGALLGGIGGLGFQLALTSAPDGDDSASDEATSAGSIAMLSMIGDTAAEFWGTVGLAACETSSGQVPVLVTGGEGTMEAPYSVQTIPDAIGPDSPCPAVTFTANTEAFTVVVPEAKTFTLELEDDDD